MTPYVCPVCNGNGLVPNGFYLQTSGCWSTSSTEPEQCRSCGGTGVVWCEDEIKVTLGYFNLDGKEILING